ncbi:ATP-grasp domain-containing protein [Pedobacter aquatilis]|uniref:ATP-grasp domain-containing protein n=1 Tax=Pedobacter aquatilis TaxID=351343 RepID=UPI002930EFE7|nr:ATP-grasp domain-containing protein [Pedobacter aquatilis]
MSVSQNQTLKQVLTVAVTGLNANDNPGPGVAVIRALREGFNEDIRIIGLAYETLEPAIYMHDLVDKTYRIPYPTAGVEALKSRLEYIQNIEKIDVLIPNFDAELFNFIKLEKDLLAIGICTFLPTQKQLEQREKVNLKSFGQQNNFFVPNDDVLFKDTDLAKTAEQFGFPFVVKGKFYEASVVQNLADAYKAFHALQAKWGLPIIVQKFIKGTEINIAGLADGNGNAISVIPMRKLYITEKGKAWAGITIEDEKLIKLAEDFAKSTLWKGGFELEIMKAENGDLYIMEVNPRFPAWVYLTVAAGQNQPKALVEMALGNSVEQFKNYKSGKMFVRYAWDNVVDVEEFQKISAFGEL